MTVVALALLGCSPTEPVPGLARPLAGARLADADWIAQGDTAGLQYGWHPADAGDVNGDGYGDLIASAMNASNGQAGEGRAFLHLGGPGGPSPLPSWIGESDQAQARYGYAQAGAGDLNGDGYDDVVVGAVDYDGGRRDEGRAWVYLGSPAGLSPTASWQQDGDQTDVAYGCSVDGAGDVNGDGFDDLIVGARDYGNGQSWEGRAFVYLGSAAGPSTVAAWTAESNQQGAQLGATVAGAGDVNGDGFDDVVVAATSWTHPQSQEGQIRVYLGSAAGLSPTPAFTDEPDVGVALLGYTLAAGDFDADGYDDVVATTTEPHGRAFVYRGSPTGPRPVSWTFTTPGLSDLQVAVGDPNGDGIDDLLIGATTEAAGQAREGVARVFFGAAGSGLSDRPDLLVEGEQADAFLGGVAAIDLDGSGMDDLVVAATGYDLGQVDEGVVFAFFDPIDDGDGDGALDLGDVCGGVWDPEQLDTDGDGLGNACDDPTLRFVGVPTVGEVLPLVVEGAAPGEAVSFWAAVGAGGQGPCPPELGGLCLQLGPGAVQLGSATADVDGVATLRPILPPIQPNGTYVLQAAIARGVGGADAVRSDLQTLDGSILDWDGDGLVDRDEVALATDPRDPDTDGDGLDDRAELVSDHDPLDADSDDDGVGDATDTCRWGDDAVDPDGDGRADACDDCPADPDPAQVDTDRDGLGDVCEGSVLVLGTPLDGVQPESGFGAPVAAGGDLNGDGRADVLVAAPYADRSARGEGAAVAWLGSPAGLTRSTIAVGGQRLARLGAAVAGVGDVDGDGLDDVVVGAPYWTGAVSEGAAFLYPGTPTGPARQPSWTANTGYQAGWAVAGAGDVNGDGFADVLVSSPTAASQVGIIDLYLGSPAGLSATPDRTMSGATANDLLGLTLAAGDLNGDGFVDVVAGTDRHDGVFLDQGQVAVFEGGPAGPSTSVTWSAEGGAVSASLGYSVAVGDVNGDGLDDLVAGARRAGGANQGAVWVWYGRRDGLAADPDWTWQPTAAGTYWGTSVASGGDVDGDGYDDVLVGALEGAALFLGGASGLPEAPVEQLASPGSGSSFGASVAFASDLDGDGLSEVLIGSPYEDLAAANVGRVWVYHGATP